ncbi:DegT/DnrJ/EryC1/StrS family aminotransferase [Corynebacterium phoceense]|uniref:DegT/DnrJ/EryC1/StrS family aminotransferase n=1 Tax=Corynebacterium phoceense TaxID=1686286 RepID=UPI00211C1772|nr:DegT/DnrJ/EryC1/StrS family aminotransferase [Corynebacterium phoceense]MCQ9335074.1 DegT/DnrJ/EryC1/StrS family aminotransferase [Corynebacterium phoceense]
MSNFIPAAKPIIGDEERAAVDRVMQTGMLAQGDEVLNFEAEFSKLLVNSAEAIAVNSGTSALHLGLLAAGIGPGDEVIVPSFTFAATANSVALTGATPVFADIDPVSFCLNPEDVEARITPSTKAIMPVHLYGHPAAMEKFSEIAKAHDLLIFEDAAQAHGASLNGQPVGTFGEFGAFSLYPTKNMTSGEGGMVTTSNPELARRVKLLRNQGMEQQYNNEVVGFNNRMTNIHAAIGRVQLSKVDGWTEQRIKNADYLNEHIEGVSVPHTAPGARHVFHQYTIRVEQDRDGFANALREEHNIGCGVYYPIPNHQLPSLAHFADDLVHPETQKAAEQVISLPVHPSLTQAELERIVKAVNDVAKAGA